MDGDGDGGSDCVDNDEGYIHLIARGIVVINYPNANIMSQAKNG